MSDLQAPTSAEHHGKMLLAATIGRHPGRAATVLSILVVLVIVIAGSTVVYRAKWKQCMNPKSNFEAAGLAKISNLSTGSNWPEWRGGSLADGGLLATDEVPQSNVALYITKDQPFQQRVMAKRAAVARMARMAQMGARRENWVPNAGGVCPPGTMMVDSTMDPSGRYVGQCGTPAEIYKMSFTEDEDAIIDPEEQADCGQMWGSDAVLEAQALAAVGGFSPASPGGQSLEAAAEGNYDNMTKGLSDAQLTSIMRLGRAV